MELLFTDYCMHCKKKFDDCEVVVYISRPYEIFLHKRCKGYYNYNNIYPHQYPINFYIDRTTSREINTTEQNIYNFNQH